MATLDQRNTHATLLQRHDDGPHYELYRVQDGTRHPSDHDRDVPTLWGICVMQQQRIEALERFCHHLQQSLSGVNEVLPEPHVERLHDALLLRPLEF